MPSVQGRREFLTRAALAGTAAVVFGAVDSRAAEEITASTTAIAPSPESAALAFVRRYSPAAALAASGPAGEWLAIDAPVDDVATMAAALGRAREAGIARIDTAGNTARFTLDGRTVEVRHVWSAA